MTSSQNKTIRIAEPAAKAAQSRVRKQFNTLVKKLESERARLAAWQVFLPELHGLVETELRPLERAAEEQRKQFVRLLDQAYEHKLLGKRDKAKLAEMILTLAELVLESGDDADISAIYKRHGGEAFELDDGGDRFKDMLEDLMGGPLGDDVDLNSQEAVMAAIHARMDEQAREAAQAAQEKAPQKPKSAKASAREQRFEAEEKRMQQSVREVYRKLASGLHPDREQDAAERDRKTALMQRVNVAYAANDLLGLLELQLEVEQLDQGSLDRMDDERIQQFNKVLSGQVRELERDNADLEYALVVDFNIEAYRRPTPQSVARQLREDMEMLRTTNSGMAQEMAALEDIKQLKAWLKTYRMPPRQPDYDDYY